MGLKDYKIRIKVKNICPDFYFVYTEFFVQPKFRLYIFFVSYACGCITHNKNLIKLPLNVADFKIFQIRFKNPKG